MRAGIVSYRISVYAFPRDRVIGDCQVSIDTNVVTALTLADEGGATGLGFGLTLFGPPPTSTEVARYFEDALWPSLKGQTAGGLIHRLSRPRGGNVRAVLHDLGIAVDNALWDLAAKQAGLPLHRLLGATTRQPEAYASGLEFHMDDALVREFYANARKDGYSGYKVKLGHPDRNWDLARLALVRDVVGDGAKIMIDANEAWTPAETIGRVRLLESAGHKLYWVEDPVLRSDQAGLRHLRAELGDVLVNSGEYLPTGQRLALLEANAVDVLQLAGGLSDGLRLAWAAGERGVPVALGNTNMNIGAHLAAALPECLFVEDSRLNTTDLLAEPLKVRDGRFVLPDVPGHGLLLSPDASRYEVTG